MKISVVICTRNRAASLERTLASLEACTAPPVDWEVIVVDNGGTDDTKDVVSSFEGRLPVHYTYEGNAGLSNARNHGVKTATGDYILWTDDDVTVDPGWLVAYADTFAKNPDAALFAGRIDAVLEEPSPPWFVRGKASLVHLLVIRNFESQEPLSNDVLPYGANFAVRTAEQRQFLYDPELGVAPGRRRNGEETAVARSILASGASGVTVPAALAYHFTPLARQTRSFVRAYHIAMGEENYWNERNKFLFPRLAKNYVQRLVLQFAGMNWVEPFARHAYWTGVRDARRAAETSGKAQ